MISLSTTVDERLQRAIARLFATPDGQAVLAWFGTMRHEQLEELSTLAGERQVHLAQGMTIFLGELQEVIKSAPQIQNKN